MSLDYSFYINTLKKVLFVISFVLLVLMFLNRTVQKFSEVTSKDNFNTGQEEQIVIEPKFIGLDKNKKPFTIRAVKAKKTKSNENLYELDTPSGEITDSSGNTIFLKSSKGEFDQNNQKIFLFKDVELTREDGLLFKTDRAMIDLNTNDIFGDTEVSGKNKKGKIFSSGFSITEKGNKILFQGKTNLLIKQKHD